MSDRASSLVADDEIDHERRRVLVSSTVGVGAVGAIGAAVPFIFSFQPSDRAKSVGAPIEIDISKLEPGQRIIANWRGQPVWVVRRSEQTLTALNGMAEQLRDPESEEEQQPAYAKNLARSSNPEYLVVIGYCTHLGCSPTFLPEDEGGSHNLGKDWRGGFYCPCHGSKFDLAGRVFKGVPAPKNLLVPPHQYLSKTLILIGTDTEVSS